MTGEDRSVDAAVEMILRYRRKTIRFAALLVAACYVIDLFQPRLAEVAAVRALWIAALLAGAALQRPERERRADLASHVVAALSGAAVVAIVALDGGTSSVYAGMLIASPFAVLVAMVELPLAAAMSGAICALGGAVIRVREGQPWIQVACWVGLALVMSALATWGTLAARHVSRIEVTTERERRRAVEQLAESELQRAEAERLAEVGRLAARVAHEVNNPLAVVKSNVQWLGRLQTTGDGAEKAEVVADTLASVERIVDAVHSVRRHAGVRPFRR